MTRRRRLAIAALCGLGAGIAYPLVDLAFACRIAASEACVWGKAYLPLTFALSTVLLGPVTTGAAYFFLGFGQHKDDRP